MDGGVDLAWFFELAKTSPGVALALAPTLFSAWIVLKATKLRGEEPAKEEGSDRLIELLEKIAASTAKSAAHAERIESIGQRSFEEELRRGGKRE